MTTLIPSSSHLHPVPIVTASDVAEAVHLAAEAVTPAPALDAFVATNPLAAWEGESFADGVAAAAAFGGRTLPSERQQRLDLEAGRLTVADLVGALVARRLVDPDPATTDDDEAADGHGPLGCSAAELLVADLLGDEPAEASPGPPVMLAERLDAIDGGARAAAVDDRVAAWCRVAVDGHAAWRVPRRELGLWGAWQWVTRNDRRLPRHVRNLVAGLPAEPPEAAAVLLGQLGLEEGDLFTVVHAHLTALPGWTAHLRSTQHGPHAGIDLVSYLAVRLAAERLVVGPSRPDERHEAQAGDAARPHGPGPDASRARARRALSSVGLAPDGPSAEVTAALLDALPPAERPMVWLEAAEAAYRNQLLAALGPTPGPARRTRPEVQLVCCIDPRSEGLRRHVERISGWETIGMAGFFALPIRLHRHGDDLATDCCPVILEPSLDAFDRPIDAAGRVPGAARAAGDDVFHAAKEAVAAPLALAEFAGGWAGLHAAWQTFLPARLAGRARPARAGKIDVPAASADDRVDLAHGLLCVAGLTDRVARLVLLCGHGSDTRNNPYAAGLACGACGGHPGGDNARLAATLLNDPAVRRGLLARGVVIPADTLFLAAEHDTASDKVTILDADAIEPGLQRDLSAPLDVLQQAGRALRAERAATLPGACGTGNRLDRRMRRRGRDWAESVPEWGLAGNAAMVIGPRALTAPLDLERRVFLHSYDADQDCDGAVLDGILGGPLVVAHWISAQYFFSTVDPDVFGAGTKATHNVIGGFGVLAGPTGDLRRGLPLQSVRVGEFRAHQPLRLLAVIEAPLARIDACLARNPSVGQLVAGGWLGLAARPTGSSAWSRRRRAGWEPWDAGTAPTSSAGAGTRPAGTAPADLGTRL